MKLLTLTGCAIAALILPTAAGAAPGESLLALVHAEGAQVYECKADAAGALTWQFREPIATLFDGGETVGRHYAGPNWEMSDGSVVAGKVVERAPGATEMDIPFLKLTATSHRGAGVLAGVESIERRDTRGGVASGPCPSAGAYLSVPYSAEYAFFGVAGDDRQGGLEPSAIRGPYDYLYGFDDPLLTPADRQALVTAGREAREAKAGLTPLGGM